MNFRKKIETKVKKAQLDNFLEFVKSLPEEKLASWIVKVEGNSEGEVPVDSDDPLSDRVDYYHILSAGKDVLVGAIMEHRELYEGKEGLVK